jgi:undecaprenyl-diphosphatase
MLRVINWLQGSDREAFMMLNGNLTKSSVTELVMPLITNLGGSVWSITLSLILLLSKDLVGNKVGERLAISLLLSHFVVRLGKKFLPRLRPYLVLENVHVGNKTYKDSSFPSGHATAAFCSATVLSSVLPAFSVVFFSLAFLVAVSRIYLGMHYPSDIAVGAAIGIIVAQAFI